MATPFSPPRRPRALTLFLPYPVPLLLLLFFNAVAALNADTKITGDEPHVEEASLALTTAIIRLQKVIVLAICLLRT